MSGPVDVWVVQAESADDPRLPGLAAEEAGRAAQFRSEQARRCFVAARRALRALLARYQGCGAGDIGIAIGENGKPFLSGSNLHFNVSHSGDLVLIALSWNDVVGVDVECIRPFADAIPIARRFFPPGEAAEVAANPSVFFRLWTRREAWLKAEGIGLAGIGREIPDGWCVADLDAGSGYAAAVAYPEPARPVRLAPFTPA